MTKNSDTLLVTGASGFVAIHCVKALFEAGYKVRGTVRSLQNEIKVKPIYDLDTAKEGRIELFEADLLKADDWENVLQGCHYVFHVASPVPLAEPKSREEIIKPAVEGTINVLKACSKSSSVKRVVCTSSNAASMKDNFEYKGFCKDDWIDPSLPGTPAYDESKMKAETSAWQFVENLNGKQDVNAFELVTICPGYILGPMIHDVHCTSAEMIRKLMMNEIPLIPHIYMATVDVRDVAKAHINAITVPQAAGRRFICIERQGWIDQLAQYVSEEFTPQGGQGYRTATRSCPYWLIWLASFFSPTAKFLLRFVDNPCNTDNSGIREVLGMTELIERKEAVLSMAYSLIERGIVPKTNKYKEREEK